MDFWGSLYLDEGEITFVLFLASQALLRRRWLQIPYIHHPPHSHSAAHVHTQAHSICTHTLMYSVGCQMVAASGVLTHHPGLAQGQGPPF